jgi:hypothetical protein
MWRHRHAWFTTGVFILGEISKRDFPYDRYAPKGPDIREPGYLAVCTKDDCLTLGINPINPNRQLVEVEP